MKPFKTGECFVRDYKMVSATPQPVETLVVEFPMGCGIAIEDLMGNPWPRAFKLVPVDAVEPDAAPLHKMELWHDR